MLATIISLDAAILLFLQNCVRTDILNPIMVCITHLGDAGILWILTGVILLIKPKTRRAGFDLLVCVALAFVFNDLIIKPLVARPRPFNTISDLTILVQAPTSYSFPSGHTNASFAAAYALTRSFGKKGAWAYLAAVLIAFSRCYVGVHYPSDVVAGMIVGTLAAMLAWYLSKKFIRTDFVKKSE